MLNVEAVLTPRQLGRKIELEVPRGEYFVREFYCDNPKCDCRRVIVALENKHTGKIDATVGHKFDPPGPDDPFYQTYLDPLGEQSDRAQGLLHLACTGLFSTPERVRPFLEHYEAFKRGLASGSPRVSGKIPRNKPCPCGSGKKYKRCCGAQASAASDRGGSENELVEIIVETRKVIQPQADQAVGIRGRTTPTAPEQKISTRSIWERDLLIRLLEDRSVVPYRRKGLRDTTVLFRMEEAEFDGFWAEFEDVAARLEAHLEQAFDQFIEAL